MGLALFHLTILIIPPAFPLYEEVSEAQRGEIIFPIFSSMQVEDPEIKFRKHDTESH